MRTINELYTILWDRIKDEDKIVGLCTEIKEIFITNIIKQNEYFKLLNHFKSQKPNENLHSEFLENETWNGGNYWWNISEYYNPVNRKAFIQKMIQITKQ